MVMLNIFTDKNIYFSVTYYGCIKMLDSDAELNPVLCLSHTHTHNTTGAQGQTRL